MNSDKETLSDKLTMTTLPIDPKSELKASNDFYKIAFQFQQIMMVYESAIKQI